MKRFVAFAVLVAAAVAVYAAQDTDITPREVKDPKQLEKWLEANASDVQSRLSAVEVGVTTNIDVIVSGNTTNRLVFTNGLLKASIAL